MTKEKEVLTHLVKRLIDDGSVDTLVVAVLESSLEDALADLERLGEKKYLEAHHWQDFVDILSFANACLKVLRWFSLNRYDSEQLAVNKYTMKIQEVI